jgi:hypothetical protein
MNKFLHVEDVCMYVDETKIKKDVTWGKRQSDQRTVTWIFIVKFHFFYIVCRLHTYVAFMLGNLHE